MSQKEEILVFLKRGGFLNAKHAIYQFRCYRLSARIYELRREGHRIRSWREEGFNIYWLEGRR
jgi:Helix-turn-helix domain